MGGINRHNGMDFGMKDGIAYTRFQELEGGGEQHRIDGFYATMTRKRSGTYSSHVTKASMAQDFSHDGEPNRVNNEHPRLLRLDEGIQQMSSTTGPNLVNSGSKTFREAKFKKAR